MAGKTKEEVLAQEQVFVDEYLLDLCQEQAAIRAGYSPRSAGVAACRLMKRPRVKDAIAKAMAERSRRTGITQDRVLREIARCAFVNPLDFINTDDATVKTGVSVDDAAAIASVKVKTIPAEDGDIVEREIKLVPKDKMLELAGKHLGMFVEKHQILEPPKIVDDVNG